MWPNKTDRPKKAKIEQSTSENFSPFKYDLSAKKSEMAFKSFVPNSKIERINEWTPEVGKVQGADLGGGGLGSVSPNQGHKVQIFGFY